MSKIYHSIGIMTGTSVDAVDIGYISTDGEQKVAMIRGASYEFPNELRETILELAGGDSHKLETTESKYTEFVVNCVKRFISKSKIDHNNIDFLGFHGQTIRHEPHNKITEQIGNAQILANSTGIDVISDFRSADIAAGGQGAPLVPIFHQAIISQLPCLILNIGGVANLTYISKNKLIGFDTGPGNALLDDYCATKLNIKYDNGGQIAASGKPNTQLLQKWLEHPYFAKPYPKSLDRNEFNIFLEDCRSLADNDALSTLTDLTALSVSNAIISLKTPLNCIYATGGGYKNNHMIKRLSEHTTLAVKSVSDLGVDGDFMEAYAFGYLAVRAHLGLPNTFPETTGCTIPTVGGVVSKSNFANTA